MKREKKFKMEYVFRIMIFARFEMIKEFAINVKNIILSHQTVKIVLIRIASIGIKKNYIVIGVTKISVISMEDVKVLFA